MPRATASTALAGHAGPDRAGRLGLGVLEHVVQLAELVVRAAGRVAAGHPDRARDVAGVAADRAADVEHDRLARLRSPGRPAGGAARRCWAPRRRSQNSARSWPSATSRSRTSRATSASVRPTSRPRGDRGDRPGPRRGRRAAAARPRPGPCASAARAAPPTRARTRAPGSTRWSPSTKAARSPSDTATAATLVRRAGRAPARGRAPRAPSGPRSPPRSRPSRAGRAAGAGPGRRGLEPGGDQRHRRAVAGREHEQRQPLQRHGRRSR